MAEMSQRAFARYMGVTLRAVQKALETQRIRLNENGKIDAEKATLEWERNTDESRKSFGDLSRRRPPPLGASTDGMEADDDGDEEMPAAGAREDQAVRDYRIERAKRERIRREREEAELAAYRGSLIDVAEAQRLAFTTFRTLRDAILNVPVRVKDLLAAETDPTRVESMLEHELAAALTQVDVDAILREQPDDGGDDGSD